MAPFTRNLAMRFARRSTAILVHGFNVGDDGAKTVARLTPFFEAAGARCQRMRYGWRGFLGVKLFNARFAQLLADLSNLGDIAVGHSNGCAIIVDALERGAAFSQIILINPALDQDYVFPRTDALRAIHVWHSPGDSTVRWARLIPWHSWGDMGAVGYRGPTDGRVTNYDKQNGWSTASSSRHSDVFEAPQLAFFGPLIVEKAVRKSYNSKR